MCIFCLSEKHWRQEGRWKTWSVRIWMDKQSYWRLALVRVVVNVSFALGVGLKENTVFRFRCFKVTTFLVVQEFQCWFVFYGNTKVSDAFTFDSQNTAKTLKATRPTIFLPSQSKYSCWSTTVVYIQLNSCQRSAQNETWSLMCDNLSHLKNDNRCSIFSFGVLW